MGERERERESLGDTCYCMRVEGRWRILNFRRITEQTNVHFFYLLLVVSMGYVMSPLSLLLAVLFMKVKAFLAAVRLPRLRVSRVVS